MFAQYHGLNFDKNRNDRFRRFCSLQCTLASRPHCMVGGGGVPTFFDSEPSLVYILHIYYKSGATLTYSPNCALVVFFSSHNG